MNQRILTQHQSQYYAWLLTRRAAGDSVESLASNLKALPEGQRQLISLVLWKLLASSTHAIAGALETMAKRLQGELDESSDVPDLAEVLDEDYESLDQIEEERADEWNGQDPSTAPPTPNERDAVAQEIAEPRHFKTLATNIRDNSKGKALLTALDRAFSELERLGAAKKALEVLAGATR